LEPELTLLFDLSVAESAVRTRKRFEAKHSDRLDHEDAAFHSRVRDAYVEIAKANPARVKLIDARGSVNETHSLVMDIVIPFLKDRGIQSQPAKGKEQRAKS
jgi:dTMP kinase